MKGFTTFKIRKSRMWIPALGFVTAYGFLHNCLIAPFVVCSTISWTNLILTLSIILGIGGSRDIVLNKFRYLGDLNPDAVKQAKGILTNKLWIPVIGWCLVGGFAVNFMAVPFFEQVREVEWTGLFAALSVLLTISGVRDYGIYAQERKNTSSDPDDETDETLSASLDNEDDEA